jgi:hypothetical protein
MLKGDKLLTYDYQIFLEYRKLIKANSKVHKVTDKVIFNAACF